MSTVDRNIYHPLLIRFARTDLMRFIGHLDWVALQQSIFLRSGFKLSQSPGPTKRIVIKTSPPTPLGTASMAEFTYVQLVDHIYPEEAARRMSGHCPDGIRVMYCRDAALLKRKNPFGSIEAAMYSLDLGSDSDASSFELVMSALEKIRSGEIPDGMDPDEIKGFWGRILEIDRDADCINLLCPQVEGKAFHATKCAQFLQDTLGIPHFPIFTKLDYYRLAPSKRRLFQ